MPRTVQIRDNKTNEVLTRNVGTAREILGTDPDRYTSLDPNVCGLDHKRHAKRDAEMAKNAELKKQAALKAAVAAKRSAKKTQGKP